jgi:Carboxypeptidase regulatory-like domain/TonB dependent receptor
MTPKSHVSFCIGLIVAALLVFCPAGFAQFSANIQGFVQDPSGAGLARAKVDLVNTATHVTATTTADSSGNYRFGSLAPGSYSVTAEASGFSKSQADVILLTEQTLNVPITLKVGAISEAVSVTAETPVVDTSDSRTQLTLENQAVAQLPVVGRNLVTLVTLAPGVSGLGTSATGSPGSGVDNFSTEEQVDASANGQGQNNNQYVVDGLDVTSGIRQGVLNLTPQPDAVQETSVQVNTFSSEYSRAAGLQTIFTTRSGTDKYHGSVSDFFNYQGMFARQHFSGPYLPFHSNNMSASFGGPVIPGNHHLFGYFAVEPLRSSQSTNGSVTFADPQFTAFAQTNFPNTVGTHLLATYLPANVSGVTVSQTAQQIFGAGAGGCGTTVGQNGVPCDLPMIDSGSFGATQKRNGTQYFARLDTVFKSDRVYASLFRTLLTSGAASAMPQFSALNPTWQIAGQLNWTHTFSPTTLNDASVGMSRVEGLLGSGAKDYTVPSISVNGINVDSGQAFGVGFAQGDFIQHNYHWRDVLTHVRGAHTLKFGYEGWYGDDVEPFQGPWSQPKFAFDNLLKLAQDAPTNEGGIMYDPATGTQKLWNWDAASRTFGLFVQDTWKVRRNLTLTMGLRYDDSGNPWSKSDTTVFGNFYLGTGSTIQQQIANGFAKPTHNALLHSVNNLFSPRVGVAWDPTGNGDWAVRGGFGIYNNWLTQANVQEEFRGSPPGLVMPTFFAGGTATAQAPIFVLGNSDKPPFGFTFPTFQGGLNAQGGVPGTGFAIGGINPLLKSPKSNIWSATVERRLGSNLSASVGYSGSHSYNIVDNGNGNGIVSYGVDINNFAGDLIQNESKVPTRLNPSFGAITYSDNTRYANYNGVFFDIRGRFARGFVDASYTRSKSQDDAQAYPDPLNPSAFYGPSLQDAPNRFSLSFNYELKGLNGGNGALGVATGGWGISGTSIFQSGYPFTVDNNASYQPICADTSPTAAPCPSALNHAVGYAPGSGDYNADGVSSINGIGLDYPDAANYNQKNTRTAFLNGSFSAGQFIAPAFGSEGNEKAGRFRGPNFAETDINFYKDTRITERVNFQFRFEVFNLFNRANLSNVDTHLLDGNFGRATAARIPRYWQLGGKISF